MKKKRRKKGSVKSAVIKDYDLGLTVPSIVKKRGFSRYTIYNCLARLNLRPIKRKKALV
jgi:hypothetical protein